MDHVALSPYILSMAVPVWQRNPTAPHQTIKIKII